jgi:lipopolysaccharide export system permease protein
VSWYRRDPTGMVTEIVTAPSASYAKPGWRFDRPTAFDVQSARQTDLPAPRSCPGVEPVQVVIKNVDADGRIGHAPVAFDRGDPRRRIPHGRDRRQVVAQVQRAAFSPADAVAGRHGGVRPGPFGPPVHPRDRRHGAGLAYFVVDNAALAMGNFGGYPPLLAAWAPFFLFLLIGETVLVRTEE